MAGLTWYERSSLNSRSYSATDVAKLINWRQANATDAAGIGWSYASLAWHPANFSANGATDLSFAAATTE